MKEHDLKFAQYLFSYDRFVHPEPLKHLMMLNYVGFKTYELLMQNPRGGKGMLTLPARMLQPRTAAAGTLAAPRPAASAHSAASAAAGSRAERPRNESARPLHTTNLAFCHPVTRSGQPLDSGRRSLIVKIESRRVA